mmetsp:Transcript_10611/g.22554  ORF Transcript_10611/g.22554 Transcript_10611/m.22554 type:complete len:95 (-) Transcript_10611:50-334(-)
MISHEVVPSQGVINRLMNNKMIKTITPALRWPHNFLHTKQQSKGKEDQTLNIKANVDEPQNILPLETNIIVPPFLTSLNFDLKVFLRITKYASI